MVGLVIALLFPGQGSQQPGMGAELAAASPDARQAFELADEVLGFALSELCFTGSDDDLRPTEVAQPALLACGYAAWLAVRDRLPAPALLAGHSLGEYAALLVAGVFDYPTALRLVRRRGEWMRDAAAASPGAMAAVMRLGDESVEALCAGIDGVQPANYNAPGQIVVSGTPGGVEALAEAARAAGARVTVLNVSGAFHSPAMRPAAEAMAAELAAVEFADAAVPVVQNVTAAPEQRGAVLRDNLARQITGPVRWTASVEAMVGAGVRRFIELGPGRVLAGLGKRIAPAVPCHSVGDGESAAALDRFLTSEVSGV